MLAVIDPGMPNAWSAGLVVMGDSTEYAGVDMAIDGGRKSMVVGSVT